MLQHSPCVVACPKTVYSAYPIGTCAYCCVITNYYNVNLWLESFYIAVVWSFKSILFLFHFSEHDECITNQHNCDENALCFNTVGGHNCVCKLGYTGNGTVCKGKLLKTWGFSMPWTGWGALSWLMHICLYTLKKTAKMVGWALRPILSTLDILLGWSESYLVYCANLPTTFLICTNPLLQMKWCPVF